MGSVATDHPTARTTAPRRGRSHVRIDEVAYPMIEFVRPDAHWPQPFSIEQAFGVMRAAIASAREFHDHVEWRGRHETNLVDHLIGGGGFGHGESLVVKSVDDLRERFRRLVLGRLGGKLGAWRKATKLDAGGTFTAAFPHHAPFRGTPFQGNPKATEGEIRKALEWLLCGNAGRSLAVSLNSCHLKAREVSHVEVTIHRGGFWFTLHYGLDGSRWSYTLARPRVDDTFVSALDRAVARMRLLMGEGHGDAGSLCEALNLACAPGPGDDEGEHWLLGRRPVHRHTYGEQGTERFVFECGIGYGQGSISICEMPSGRVVARDPSYDHDRMKALRTILEARFPAGSSIPTTEVVSAIKEAETVEVRPSYDAEGRYLFDNDRKPLSPEALARKPTAAPDEEIDPEGLF